MSADHKPSFFRYETIGVTAFFSLKTAILIAGSAAVGGRLALPPVYDDVTYFVDGLQRLEVFHNHGMIGLVRNLVSSPPHAPYSSIAAMFGFLVAGPVRGAAYAMNGLAALLITLFWLRLFRVPTPLALLAGMIIVSTGWFDMVVMTFHPDLMFGYGVATIVAALIFQVEVLSSPFRTIAVGIAAGLVLLTKPVGFPAALILFAIAWAWGAFVSRHVAGSYGDASRRLATILIAATLVAAPYFVPQLPGLIAYIHAGFVDQVATWRSTMSVVEGLLFYFREAGVLLGVWFYIGCLIIGIALLGSMILRKWTELQSLRSF